MKLWFQRGKNMKMTNRNSIVNRLIVLAVVAVAAWLLGQWIVPAIMKIIFL